MSYFLPSYIVVLLWCSLIETKKFRRRAQVLATTIYVTLGQFFI